MASKVKRKYQKLKKDYSNLASDYALLERAYSEGMELLGKSALVIASLKMELDKKSSKVAIGVEEAHRNAS